LTWIILGGDEQPGKLACPRQRRDGQHAANVAHGSIQAQLAHDERAFKRVRWNLPRPGQHADGDGQVVAGAGFAQIRKNLVITAT